MRSLLKSWWRAVVAYPQRTLSLEDDSYEGYWKERGREQPLLSPWQKERADLARRYILEEGGATFSIVDVGCGDGAVLAYLKKFFPGMKGMGVDFSEFILQRVRDAGFEARAIDFSDPHDLVLPEADYILLFEIIEHVTNSELLITKALAASKKKVFISIPNSGFFTYRLRLLLGKFPAQWVNKPNEHVRFWTLADTRWWLRALGLEKQATVHSYQGVPILKHLLPSLFAAGIFITITPLQL